MLNKGRGSFNPADEEIPKLKDLRCLKKEFLESNLEDIFDIEKRWDKDVNKTELDLRRKIKGIFEQHGYTEIHDVPNQPIFQVTVPPGFQFQKFKLNKNSFYVLFKPFSELSWEKALSEIMPVLQSYVEYCLNMEKFVQQLNNQRYEHKKTLIEKFGNLEALTSSEKMLNRAELYISSNNRLYKASIDFLKRECTDGLELRIEPDKLKDEEFRSKLMEVSQGLDIYSVENPSKILDVEDVIYLSFEILQERYDKQNKGCSDLSLVEPIGLEFEAEELFERKFINSSELPPCAYSIKPGTLMISKDVYFKECPSCQENEKCLYRTLAESMYEEL
ncbi:hypothetical protein DRJ17_05265 [Candidatus Woesearchaeota archaeon]|nr:MAG: hypothetical protein DRJ17_05265 [Candidatus Woesearchaeota archaeon]